MTDHRYTISAIANLLKLVVGRGRVQSGKDDGPVQFLQVINSAKETTDLRRVAEFGFTSWPMKGADAVAVFISGDRSNGVIIATNDQRYRFKLENPGEAALSDAFGKSIWFKKDDGGMVVDAAGTPVTINNAKGLTINSSDNVVLNMNGKTVVINDAGEVQLNGAGGKSLVRDGDPVVDGVVQATQDIVTA